MKFGRFRACSCLTDVGLRKWRVDRFELHGHLMGPFTVLVHEQNCFGMKGGDRVKVWLMKLKGSALGKFEYNDYVHPDALPRGEIELMPSELRKLESLIENDDWPAIRQSLNARLRVIARRHILEHFPKAKKAA